MGCHTSPYSLSAAVRAGARGLLGRAWGGGGKPTGEAEEAGRDRGS